MTPYELFEAFALLLALRLLDAVPGDWCLLHMLFLLALTPFLVMGRAELRETAAAFLPRHNDPDLPAVVLRSEVRRAFFVISRETGG